MSRFADFISGGMDPSKLCRTIGMRPDPWQLDALRSRDRRLLLNVTRQGGKSTTAAILAVWEALYSPGADVILVSRAQRQSSELFRRALTLYRALGKPVSSEVENQLSLTLESGSRIISLPGDADTIRGYSNVSLLVVDEAARVEPDLFAAVSPMLAISDGRMVLMSTPAGRKGFFYEASKSPDWKVVTIPASMCPRIKPEVLEQQRRLLGPWRFDQEFNCTFGQSDDQIFDAAKVLKAFNAPWLPRTPDLIGLPGEAPQLTITSASRPRLTVPRPCQRDPEHLGHHRRERGGSACMLCGESMEVLV